MAEEQAAERAERDLGRYFEAEYRKAYAELHPSVRELERELRQDRGVVKPR
jgi:hypothetical protein